MLMGIGMIWLVAVLESPYSGIGWVWFVIMMVNAFTFAQFAMEKFLNIGV